MNKVTYRDLLERYGTHELCPKSIPVTDVNEVLSESEIAEYQKRMELFSDKWAYPPLTLVRGYKP